MTTITKSTINYYQSLWNAYFIWICFNNSETTSNTWLVVNEYLFELNFRLDNIFENDKKNGENLGTALEQAIKEATDDETFRKVKRMSYSGSGAEEVSIT